MIYGAIFLCDPLSIPMSGWCLLDPLRLVGSPTVCSICIGHFLHLELRTYQSTINLIEHTNQSAI